MASKPNTKDTMTRGKVKSESAGEYELTLKYDGFTGSSNQQKLPKYRLEIEDSEGNINEYGFNATKNAGINAINGVHIKMENAVRIAMEGYHDRREFGITPDSSESFMRNYLTHLEDPQNNNMFSARQYMEILDENYGKRRENLEALGHETGNLESQLRQTTLESSNPKEDRVSFSDIGEALNPFNL